MVFPSFAASGGLVSYGTSPIDQFRQGASYVDLILKGAKAADLPVQFPTKYELVVNYKTARALGLKVSEAFLQRRRRQCLLWPKADICLCIANVRFRGKADMTFCGANVRL